MGNQILEAASASLKAGDVIAYPTEAVWGIGCDPFNKAAVHRILDLKNRPVEKGLILVAGNFEQLGQLLEPLHEDQIALLKSTWPGPITWLIPDESNLFPPWIKGVYESVAIRVSSQELVRDLCLKFGGPIVSTSANIAGRPEIRDQSQIEDVFGDTINCVVTGELGGQASTSEIRDLITGQRLR